MPMRERTGALGIQIDQESRDVGRQASSQVDRGRRLPDSALDVGCGDLEAPSYFVHAFTVTYERTNVKEAE